MKALLSDFCFDATRICCCLCAALDTAQALECLGRMRISCGMCCSELEVSGKRRSLERLKRFFLMTLDLIMGWNF